METPAVQDTGIEELKKLEEARNSDELLACRLNVYMVSLKKKLTGNGEERREFLGIEK